MTEQFKKAIELDKILHMLSEQAVCGENRQAALCLPLYDNSGDVSDELEKTDDMLKLVLQFGEPRISNTEGALSAEERAVKGGTLSMAELLCVASALRNFRYFKQWYAQNEEPYYLLDEIFNRITPQQGLETAIYDAILSENEMADTASDTLYEIRRKIRSTEGDIRQKLDSLIKSGTKQKYLQESVVALRGGRFVVPVKAENRSEIEGVVHDVSSSGSTLFVEPAAVVQANAKILQLKNQEQEEIERILTAFSANIASIGVFFEQSYANMLAADMILAKAKLAIKQNANKPKVNNECRFKLVRCRHPLIDKEKAVPIDISLGWDYDTLVITGPNTGGKTVSLKTAGLLCAMAQCGMLIPAHEESSVCVFEDILVDIGDEQSIEQSLSTFSGHMKNITRILKAASRNTLVLLDELGAGTDPAEGAALAVSVIEKLRMSGALIMATTHYGEMKIFALETDGVQNASCEFNVETLSPTYKLSVGVPGKSNAFLISEKLGVPQDVIQAARDHLSQEDRRFDSVLNQLEDLKLQLKEGEDEIQRLKYNAEHQLEKAKEKRDQIIAQGERELEAARDKAQRMVSEVQNEAYRLMDEMKKLQKQQNLTAQQKAQRAKEIAAKESEKLYGKSDIVHNPTAYYQPLKSVNKGDSVIIASLNKQATVTALPDKNGMVEVMAGMIKTKVKLSDLTASVKNSGAAKKKYTPQKRQANGTGGEAQPRTAAMEINLLGYNVDEAILETDRFIDNALMTGLHTVYLIHGKGTGALRAGLQAHLKTHHSVKSFRNGAYGEGEAGVTVVELK